MSSTFHFYNQNAGSLAEQYDSTTFEQVHTSWQAFVLLLVIVCWMLAQAPEEMLNG